MREIDMTETIGKVRVSTRDKGRREKEGEREREGEREGERET